MSVREESSFWLYIIHIDIQTLQRTNR